jgi:hypothetical protein
MGSMAADPYVAARLDEAPRQEQNLAPGVHRPAARAWYAARPGDLAHGQPRGELFGSPGPNIGYGQTLANRARDRLALAPHEHADDALAVIGEVAMKRAASYGRAPVPADVECAMLVLGYQGGCAPAFAEWRASAVEGAHHDYRRRRALCDAVVADVLRLAPAVIASQLDTLREQVRERAELEALAYSPPA